MLLKNDGTLPISSSKGLLALIGPWAAATTQMQGNYAGVAPYLHSPLYAAQQAGFSVAYAQGADINSDNTTGYAAALAIAKAADIIVYLGGIDDSIEAEAMVIILESPGKVNRFDLFIGPRQHHLASRSTLTHQPAFRPI